MQSNTTQKNIRAYFRQGLMLLLLMVLATGVSWAQPYINGNLSTGTTNAAGTITAPVGYTFSELQAGLNAIGTPVSVENGVSHADDFTVPAGQTWNITTIEFYAYSTGYVGATSPFDEVRLQIFNTNPSVGTPTPIFGDLTTNRLSSSVSAQMYRITNTSTAANATQREIWKVIANVPTSLTTGTYWIEWQIGTIASVTSNFSPASTVVGTTTQAGNNSMQHVVATNTWSPFLDLTFPQDMPFRINYTSTACGGTPPTITVTPTTGLCSPVTLTASGATDYTWSPAAGLNTTTGATVTASPTVATTYTVTGVTAGCAGTATVTVDAGATSAVLTGVTPSTVLLNENFDGGLPATWTSINNSDVIGGNPDWEPGAATLFPPFNGGATSFVYANYASTDGTVISNWLLTSQINTISNGDVLSFYTRTTTPGATVWPDRLEVRLSTAGASTNVGTTPTSVGDFTILLLTVNPDLTTTGYPSDWTRFEATVTGLAAPASGRIAFRYFVTDAGPNGTNSDLIALDQVRLETLSSCTAPGATQTINVAVNGGTGPFTVVYNDGTSNQTVNNYTSGADIQVAPLTSATYTLVSVTSANGCQAAAVSGSFSINISAPPVIATQPPAALSLCAGQGGILTVGIPGTNTYQWQVSLDGGATFNNVTDNSNYSGSTNDTLTFANVPGAFNDYRYQVIVTSACGTSVTSTPTTVTVTSPATITTQPTDVVACSGTDAVFTIATAGTGVTLQWEVSTDGGATWGPLAGETGTTLTVPAVNIAQNGYLYRAMVSSCGTPLASSVGTLTVQESIVITTQPVSIAACAGNNATFAVIATGTGNTYQWQESTDGGVTFTNIPGANGATYSTPAVTAGMDNYQYQVIISNPCGAPVTSAPATLTLTSAAAITGEPTDVAVCTGSAASFTVTATGATSYQWQVSTDGGTTFTDITGETAPTLNLPTPTTAINGNIYRVLVGSCGTPLVSANAAITVNDPVVINTQPASTSACDGGAATFTVDASGTNVTYQWQMSSDGGVTFTDIAGETNTSLTLPAVTAAMNSNQYQVVINNPCTTGLISAPATLTISAIATITSQPANVTICDGANTSFTVVAGGATGYQWQVSTDGGATFNDIAGETNATLNLTGVGATSNNYQYRVAITSCGPTPITSNAATLTVNPVGAITTQPVATSACNGGTANFSVVATGNNLTYQWEISNDGGTTWTPIAGATTASASVTATAASQVRVVINGDCITAPGLTSTAAALTITPAAVITAQPTAVSGCEGSDATFNVTASDATGYQWQVSTDGGTTFTDVAGATSATLTLPAVAGTSNDYQYRVVASNACGDVTSSAATLTVNASPTVTVAADVTSVQVGETATLTATATPATATYQWFVDGVAIPGATSATYAATTNTPGVYDYTVEVTGDGGCTVTSDGVEITVTTTNVAFIAPNANRGTFKVSYSNIGTTASARVITVYDSKGRLVYNKTFPVNLANNVEVMDVTVPLLPSGIYWLMLSESNGKRLKTEQLIIQR